MDGDLLQLVVLVEPPELAVGEGVADSDGSHGRAGGDGWVSRGWGTGAARKRKASEWVGWSRLQGRAGVKRAPAWERNDLGEYAGASRSGPRKLDRVFFSG